MSAIIIAILVVTSPGEPPDNLAAFFTEDGAAICQIAADELNRAGTENIYVCEVQ